MGPILLGAGFLVTFTLVLVVYLWLDEYLSLRQTLGYITGPKDYPFIGLSWEISKIPRRDRFEWFNHLCYSYKNGMVVTWFGVEPIVNIRKPRHMEVILSSYTYLTKTRVYKVITPWLGSGLLTATGETWYHRRRLISSAFNKLNDYVPVMQEKIEILMGNIDKIMSEKPGKPINVYNLITKYTLDSACKTALGIDVEIQQKPDNNGYMATLHNFCRISTDRYFKFWMKWNFIFFRTKMGKEFRNAVKIMHRWTERMIRQKWERRLLLGTIISGENDTPETDQQKAFLDHLFDANERTAKPLTLQEMRQELDTFLFTGHGTTFTAICWALFALGNAPKIQAKVQNELNRIFGSSLRPATIQQLNYLTYLDLVIKEVLRFYPSIPSIGRCLDGDIVIDNCFIPKGTIVNIQIYQLHHDPEIWRDPETFNPDRFLPENSKDRHEYAFIPFSTGPRNCVGQNLALLEIKLVLSTILRKWHISSVSKPNEMKMISDFILRPSNDVIDVHFKLLKKTSAES